MCNISVCQDTGEENGKLASSQGGLPSRYCECPMTIVRAEDTVVKRTYFQSFLSSSQDGNHISFPSSFFPFSSTNHLRLVFPFLPFTTALCPYYALLIKSGNGNGAESF